MKAMIMAAGIGTRLRPLTNVMPKPMIPVVNRPVMEYGVMLLRQHGVTDIIANTHYCPERITGYFGDGGKWAVSMNFSYEEELKGTAGGVRNNAWFLDETFAVVSGDALTDINLSEMLAFHKASGALVTLALKQVEEVSQYGVTIFNEEKRITGFQEKPAEEEALSNLANTGIYIFEPEIFNFIPEGFYDFGKDLFPRLVEEKERIYGYVTESYWSDVGSHRVYVKSNRDVLSGGLAGLEYDFCRTGKNFIKGKNILMDDLTVIGDNVTVGDDTSLRAAIVLDGAVIGRGCVIDGAVVGEGARVPDGTVLGAGEVVEPEPNSK